MRKTFSKYILSLTILLLGVANLYANTSALSFNLFDTTLNELTQEAKTQTDDDHLAFITSNSSDSEKHRKEYEERVTEEEFEEDISSSKKTTDQVQHKLASLLYAFLLDYHSSEQNHNCFSSHEQFSNLTSHTPIYIRLCVYRL